MRGIPFLAMLVLLSALTLPQPAGACPSCAEAVPLSCGAEESDEARQARAYNNSIYLMVGMPYLLLGAVCFMVCRGLRQRTALVRLSGPSVPGGAVSRPLAGDSPSCQPSTPDRGS